MLLLGLIAYSAYLTLRVLILIPINLFMSLNTKSHLYLDYKWKIEWEEYRLARVAGLRFLYDLLLMCFCFPRRTSVLPTSSTVGLSMPFDKGFRLDSVKRRGLRSLLLSFECLSSVRPARDPSTTLPLLRNAYIFLSQGASAMSAINTKCNAHLLGSFLTCSIPKTRFFHSGRISVVRARMYARWSFLYDVTHPATKDSPLNSQVLHAFRVLTTS